MGPFLPAWHHEARRRWQKGQGWEKVREREMLEWLRFMVMLDV